MIAAAAGECNCSLIECEKQLHPVYEWTKLVECRVKHECKDIDLLFVYEARINCHAVVTFCMISKLAINLLSTYCAMNYEQFSVENHEEE